MGNVRGKLIGLNKILRMRSLHYSLEGYSTSQVRTGNIPGHLAHRQKKTPFQEDIL
jgi:F420-0:gamma-glutamyl ligase-like protein